jgi:hypothetical protein
LLSAEPRIFDAAMQFVWNWPRTDIGECPL